MKRKICKNKSNNLSYNIRMKKTTRKMKLNKITNFSLEKAAIKPQEDNKHQDLNTKRE